MPTTSQVVVIENTSPGVVQVIRTTPEIAATTVQATRPIAPLLTKPNVTKGDKGDKGDTGLTGVAGADGDINYTHNQSVPSTVWTINHNLSKYPSVSIVDSAGSLVIGDVLYITPSTVTVTFSSGFSGKAFLN